MSTKEQTLSKEKTVSVQDIANRLTEFCRQGDFAGAQKELYSSDAESIEPEKAAAQGWTLRVKGTDQLIAKGKQWEGMVDAFHGSKVSEPVVAGNFISLAIGMDVTMKGQPRGTWEEIGVFEVRDGKIVSEEFFY